MKYSEIASVDLVTFLMTGISQHNSQQYRPNALFFCNAVASAIIQLRDQGLLKLMHNALFAQIRYSGIIALSKHPALHEQTVENLHRYMAITPGLLDSLVHQQIHQHTVKLMVNLLQSLNGSAWDALGRRVNILTNRPERIRSLVTRLLEEQSGDAWFLYQNLLDIGIKREQMIDLFDHEVRRAALSDDLSL